MSKQDVIALTRVEGEKMFAPYGIIALDVEQPEGDAVIVPFGREGQEGVVFCAFSGNEVRMNAEPDQMAAMVRHRLNNCYRTFQNNGGV